MSKFVKNVWKNVKDAHRVTNNPKRWDELLEAPKRHYARSTSTTLGKIAMAALAAWGAGAAMGAMGGGSGAAGAGAGAGEAAGTTAAEGLISGAGGTGTSTGAVATANTATGTISQGAVMPNVAGEAISAGIQQGGVASTAGGGFGSAVKSGLSYVGKFAANNPELSAAALQGVASAASPDEMDIMREQEEIRNERLARGNKNIADAGGIELDMVGGTVLRDQYGDRVYGPGSGLIQKGMGLNSPLRNKRGDRVSEEEQARLHQSNYR